MPTNVVEITHREEFAAAHRLESRDFETARATNFAVNSPSAPPRANIEKNGDAVAEPSNAARGRQSGVASRGVFAGDPHRRCRKSSRGGRDR